MGTIDYDENVVSVNFFFFTGTLRVITSISLKVNPMPTFKTAFALIVSSDKCACVCVVKLLIYE